MVWRGIMMGVVVVCIEIVAASFIVSFVRISPVAAVDIESWRYDRIGRVRLDAE